MHPCNPFCTSSSEIPRVNHRQNKQMFNVQLSLSLSLLFSYTRERAARHNTVHCAPDDANSRRRRRYDGGTESRVRVPLNLFPSPEKERERERIGLIHCSSAANLHYEKSGKGERVLARRRRFGSVAGCC